MNSPFFRYQRRWLADTARVRVWEKSRRIGASWVCAFESVLDAMSPGGLSTYYVSYNRDVCQEFISDATDWARACNAGISGSELGTDKDDQDNEFLTYTVRFPSGHKVVALSSRPANLRNRRGRIVVDEAAHVPDLPETIKAAMAILMWGGRVDIISTHNGVDSEFNRIVTDIRAEKLSYSLHRTTIDDALAEGLFRRICAVLRRPWSENDQVKWRTDLVHDYGDYADEELLCVPAHSGGVYLTRDLLERAMFKAPVLRLTTPEGFVTWPEPARVGHVKQWLDENVKPLLATLPRDQMHFFGEDFGRTSDRTVIAPGYLAQDLGRVHPFAVELLNVPFDQQRQVLFYVVDALPRFIKGALDATGNGAQLAENTMQRYGESRIECVKLSEPWYAINLPPFKAALEDDALRIPRDADHLLDLSALRVINGIPKLPKSRTKTRGDGPARHGDAAIAYALAHYASRLPIMEYGYEKAPKMLQQTKMLGARAEQSHMNFRRRAGGLL